MLMRAYAWGESETALTFADADQITWSAGFVAMAVEKGIIVGNPDNTFAPVDNVTRAEMFTMIAKCLAKVAEENAIEEEVVVEEVVEEEATEEVAEEVVEEEATEEATEEVVEEEVTEEAAEEVAEEVVEEEATEEVAE